MDNNISMDKITLKRYISNNKTPFGDKNLTHQWWDNEGNVNFKISDDNYNEFLKIYCKELKTNDSILHVMEQPMDVGPMCLDFDFKQITPERRIGSDNIMHIVGIINNIVVKYFDMTNKNVLDSYVLMKSEPFYNKKKMLYSDGFHLQYPNLILGFIDRYLIYQESRKEIIRQDLFSEVYADLVKVNSYKKQDNSDSSSDNDDSDIESKNENNYYLLSDKEKEKINDEIFDPCIITKNKWFLYGSGKNIDGDINLYQLAYIFDYNIDEIDEKPTLKELVKLLSIRKPTNKENQINSIESDEYNELIEQVKLKYIKKQSDKIFDINKLFIKQTTDEQNNIEINTNKQMIDFSKKIFNTPTEQENITFAKDLVKLLNKERASPYNEWISVGWCLYNISPTLLKEFIDFSKLAGKKFDKNGCEKVWEDCYKRNNKTGYSLPSLIKWAKEDNVENFKLLLRKRLNKSIEGRDLRTDFDVAHIVHEYYKHDYVCSGIDKKVWWEYNNNKWNRIDSAYTLSIKLSTDLALEFAHISSDVVKLAITENGQSSDVLHKKSKTITDLIFNLKKSAFKDKIIKEAAGLFLQKDFESKLDQNIYLVGFTNGTYDLRNRIFRKGEPGDMIRKNVGYDYKEFKRDDPLVIETENFLESIQPEKDMRDYLGAYVASFLEGSNKDQKFMIWTGCHAFDQGIMMHNGTIKKVQDIIIGDKLMGDDSKPRKVLKLIRGNDTMCEIVSNNGNKFKVNLDHILSLKALDTLKYCWSARKKRYKLKWQSLENEIPKWNIKYFSVKNNKSNKKSNKTSLIFENKLLASYSVKKFCDELYKNNNIIKKDDIIDISVKNYIKHSKLFGENNYLLFKTGVEYEEQQIDFDPYKIGYFIGNHKLNDEIIINQEDQSCYIENKIKLLSGIDNKKRKRNTNTTNFSDCLTKYNLMNNKHIPTEFMLNSRENRLKLLAGIIDANNGEHITITTETLYNDILFLINSLGFGIDKYMIKLINENKECEYYKIKINGLNIDEMRPLLQINKFSNFYKNNNTNLMKFKINILDEKENYYGFQVDENHRYLMDDFIVTHNCGQNGKGSLIDLIDNTFNGTDEGYFATLPPTVLTQKRGSSSAATPELATKFGKRVIVLQEPEGDDKINVGFMKNITGQDKIEARPLYGEPFQYTPLFKLLLACNHLPSIPSDDGGTWRRIRVIDFMIKFTSNPQGPNEKKSDSKLRDKMKEWGQAFMWLLINVYYPMYVENDGLDKLEPERVKIATNKYKEDSNAIMEFFNDSLEKDPDSEIVLGEIYESFKVWYIGNFNDKKPMKSKKFKEYFELNNFKIVSTSRGVVVKGIKIKEHKGTDNNDYDNNY